MGATHEPAATMNKYNGHEFEDGKCIFCDASEESVRESMAACRKPRQLREELSPAGTSVGGPSSSPAPGEQPQQTAGLVRRITETPASKSVLPPIENSIVASALSLIAVLELIGAPIAGLGVGSDNTFAGWMVFVSGIVSGLIFLGFSRVIQNTFESSQRLKRLEMLIERRYDEK